jgi:hypothetical protein
MVDNPYRAAPIEAELVQRPQKPPKTFSWVMFLIIVIGGHFIWLTDWLSEVFDNPAYRASSFTARLVILIVVGFLISKLAAKF